MNMNGCVYPNGYYPFQHFCWSVDVSLELMIIMVTMGIIIGFALFLGARHLNKS